MNAQINNDSNTFITEPIQIIQYRGGTLQLRNLLFLSILITGCTMELRPDEFNSTLDTVATRYTESETLELTESGKCVALEKITVKAMTPFTPSGDVREAAWQMDAKLVELGANAYQIVDHDWMAHVMGTVLYIDFIPLKCDHLS